MCRDASLVEFEGAGADMAGILRPCGACAELVDPETGCPHWWPGRAEAIKAVRAANLEIARARRAAADRARANAQKAVAEFYRIFT